MDVDAPFRLETETTPVDDCLLEDEDDGATLPPEDEELLRLELLTAVEREPA